MEGIDMGKVMFVDHLFRTLIMKRGSVCNL